MTAKEYLSQARSLKQKIEQKQKLLEELKTKATAAGSLHPKDVMVQSSRDEGSRLEAEVIKYADLELQIRRDIRDYYEKVNEIIDAIHRLDDSRYIMVLHAKWIDGDSLERIAADSGYSFDHTRRLYTQSMKAMDDMINL